MKEIDKNLQLLVATTCSVDYGNENKRLKNFRGKEYDITEDSVI